MSLTKDEVINQLVEKNKQLESDIDFLNEMLVAYPVVINAVVKESNIKSPSYECNRTRSNERVVYRLRRKGVSLYGKDAEHILPLTKLQKKLRSINKASKQSSAAKPLDIRALLKDISDK